LVAEKLGIKATFIAGKNAAEKTTAARIPLLDKVQDIVGAETVRKYRSAAGTGRPAQNDGRHSLRRGRILCGLGLRPDRVYDTRFKL